MAAFGQVDVVATVDTSKVRSVIAAIVVAMRAAEARGHQWNASEKRTLEYALESLGAKNLRFDILAPNSPGPPPAPPDASDINVQVRT